MREWNFVSPYTRCLVTMTSLVLLKIFGVKCLTRVGCLTVHLAHEITLNANLIQLGNFIDVLLGRHVSGTYAHRQEHWTLCCSIWFSAPSFWMGGGLESRCTK